MKDQYIRYIIDRFREVPTTVYVVLLALFCFGVVSFCACLGIRKGLKWSSRLLLLEYCFIVISITLIFRTTSSIRSHSFVLFRTYQAILEGNNPILLIQNIMNVEVFIPVGFLLGCGFGQIKWWKVLLAGAFFSVSIETLQFLLKRGFAEFDDVLHNILGCMIGYGLYVVIVHIVRALTKKRTITPNNKIEII